MAFIFSDSFDHYTVLSIAAPNKWTSVAGTPTIGANGRNGSKGVVLDASDVIKKTIGVNTNKIFVGFALKVTTVYNAELPLLTFRRANADQCTITLGPNLLLQARTGSSVGTLIATATRALPFNAYRYVEVGITVGDATGTIEVRIDGVAVINEVNVDTKGTAVADLDEIWIGAGGGTPAIAVDDVYILDNTTVDLNTYLGDVYMQLLLSDGAGSQTDFTLVGAATNWEAVKEIPPDDDTSYVGSTVVGNEDLYTFGALGLAVATIKACVVNIRARKTDAGVRTIRAEARQNVTTGESADISVGDDYEFFQSAFPNNPDTGVAWTIAGVDSAEFGVKDQA